MPTAIVGTIACSEFCVLSLMFFFYEATYGVIYRQSDDPRLRDNVGVLAPMSDMVRDFVYRTYFLAIIEGCDIDKNLGNADSALLDCDISRGVVGNRFCESRPDTSLRVPDG